MQRIIENEEMLKSVNECISSMPDEAPASVVEVTMMQVEAMTLVDIAKSLAVIADAMEVKK